jgi:hypothetical protein
MRAVGLVMIVIAVGMLWFGRLKFSNSKGVPSNLVFSPYLATCVFLLCLGLFFLLGVGAE